MRQIAAFLREYVPGFEKAYVAQSGVNVGVRETRRVLGGYQTDGGRRPHRPQVPGRDRQRLLPRGHPQPEGKGTIVRNVPFGEA
jgi:hypothetical protein